jgi:tetratricopeptide (TPR) repeat protein
MIQGNVLACRSFQLNVQSKQLGSRPLGPILVLTLLIAATFLPVLFAQFVHWDDFTLVVNNSYFDPVRWESFVHFWTQPHVHLYTPLAYTVWALVAAIFSPTVASSAFAFHLLNLLLHLLATVLAFLLLGRLTKNNLAAFFGAAVFAVHPLQVEAVAWISGMNNLLAGAISIGALLAYVLYAQSDSRRDAKIYYVIATLCLILALFSKPTAVVVPLLAIAIDFLILRRSVRQVTIAIGPWIALAVIFAVIARIAQPPLQEQSLPLRMHVALDSLGFYFSKVFLPIKLCADYGRTPGWLAKQGGLFFPILVLVIACAVASRRKSLAAILIFAAALLPVLGFFPFDFQEYSTVADRYAYLPMLGVAILIAEIFANSRKSFVLPIMTFVVIVFAAMSFVQSGYWKDTNSLFERTLTINPESLMANRGYAAMFVEQGKLDDAETFAERAVTYHSDSPDAHLNLAAVFMARGDFARAAEQYDQTLLLRSNDVAGHYSLAGALAQLGHLDAALEQAQIATRLDPNDAQAHLNLGAVLSQMNRTDAAIAELRIAVQLAPRDVRANSNLGYLLLGKNQSTEAAKYFRAALEVNPNYLPAQRGLRQVP